MQCTFILGFETLVTFLEDLFLLEEIKFPDTNLSPHRICSLLFTRALTRTEIRAHTYSRAHIVFHKVFFYYKRK